MDLEEVGHLYPFKVSFLETLGGYEPKGSIMSKRYAVRFIHYEIK